ncbi:MAG: hypothetical protein Q4C96_04200 [Planctomycetia bacterium]|nr:hypothetical protein [Planctomycetia bacterium]
MNRLKSIIFVFLWIYFLFTFPLIWSETKKTIHHKLSQQRWSEGEESLFHLDFSPTVQISCFDFKKGIRVERIAHYFPLSRAEEDEAETPIGECRVALNVFGGPDSSIPLTPFNVDGAILYPSYIDIRLPGYESYFHNNMKDVPFTHRLYWGDMSDSEAFQRLRKIVEFAESERKMRQQKEEK